MNELRDLFLLDPGVFFLNHGSFGATPRPVMEAYQEWQILLEREPVYFVDRLLADYFKSARQALGAYVNADADDLVYVTNATFGVNVVARSLRLGPGDEVLASNHEYGACENVWQFLSRKRGFGYIQQPIPLPVGPSDEIVEQFWRGITRRTKVIFLSHISSPTAVRMPVEAICSRAREAGILTVIDGAHAPGQIPLDLEAIGADFYTGNGHKWLCSPKGSGFLHARRDKQHLIEPLVVGWGWGVERTVTFGSDYLDYQQWLGTSDPAAYFSVPAAIEFQAKYNWPAVRQRCHIMLRLTLQRIGDLTGLAPMYPNADFYCQMAIAPLPPIADLPAFKRRLFEEFHVEVPCIQWQGKQFIRVSVQGYNTDRDIDALIQALTSLLPA